MSSLTLPTSAGVILLRDTTLFPHGAFPLHIFEPRYRKMLEDALEGNCMFCVGHLRGEEEDDFASSVSPVGTIGLIRASRESESGTSNLLLHGLHRVRFESWQEGKDYPFATIRPLLDTTLTSVEVADFLPRLQHAVEAVLRDLPEEIRVHVRRIFEADSSLSHIADAISQQFIHEPEHRQQLLETTELRQRLDLLITLLQGFQT